MTAEGLECRDSRRPLVNGIHLSKFVGKTVTLVGTVISVNPKGTSFDLKTPDMQVVIVSMRKPMTEPVSGLVEVHGIVQSKSSIICNYYMVFPSSIAETFDQELTNKALTIMHTIPNAWTDDV